MSWSDDNGGFFLGQCKVLQVTDKAFLLDSDEVGEVWIPKSQILEDSELDAQSTFGDKGAVEISEWFAKQKDWL